MPHPDEGAQKSKKGDTVVVHTTDGHMSEGTLLAIFAVRHGRKIRVRCDHRIVMVDADQIIEMKD